MHYNIFNIPIPDSREELERMNKFLCGARVISAQKEVVITGGLSYWSFVVEYYREDNSARIDYKEILSKEDFAVYSKLWELRKQMAEKESVPVYTVFTNEQLAEIVKKRVVNKNMLSAIHGIGSKKIEKYGEKFIEIMRELYEKSRESVRKNNGD